MPTCTERRRLARWAGAALTALVLAGCDAPHDVPAPRASPESTATATAPALQPWPLHHQLELQLRIAARRAEDAPAELPQTQTDVHVLVWRDLPDGAESLWLQVQTSPDQLAAANRAHDAGLAELPLPPVQVLARRSGRWLVGRDGLWQWQTALRRIRTCDPAACAEAEATCVPVLQRNGPFQGRVMEARLVPLGGGAARPVGPRVSDQAALALASPGFLHRPELLGSIGSSHWLRIQTEVWSCGTLAGHTAEADAQLLVPDGLLLAGLDTATERSLVEAYADVARSAVPDAPTRQPTAVAVSIAQGSWQASLVWMAVGEAPLPGAATPIDHQPLELPLVELPVGLQAIWALRPPLQGIADTLPPAATARRPAQPDVPLRGGFGVLPAEPTIRARWLQLFSAAQAR